MSKKLQQKQQKRLAEEARKARQRKSQRRANLITIGIAVAVLGGVAAFVYLEGNGPGGASASVGGSAAEANCTDVESHPSEGNKHVSEPVDYKSNPPASGNHFDQAAAPGFYADTIAPEGAVHAQEHGQIVIWYRPDAPQEVKDQISSLVEQEPAVNLAVPWEDLEPPYNFALTAWSGADDEGKVQRCEQVSQDVWDDFRAEFQGKGPEPAGIPPFEPDEG